MDTRLLSRRVAAIAGNTPLRRLFDFFASGYQTSRHEPGVLDFTFGNPHDPPSTACVAALREIGYRVHVPEGTFYLFPESPLADDEAFVKLLGEEGVLAFPGRLFETPGYFRICLTATLETIEASLPAFAEAFAQATELAAAD